MIYAFIIRYHRVLIAVGLVLALALALHLYVSGKVKDARQADAVAAIKADAKADDIAGQVAASGVAEVEKENEHARNQANAGDDMLGDGLRGLRK